MRTKSHPDVIGIVFAAYFLIAAVLIQCSAGCISMSMPPLTTSNIIAQDRAAVMVVTDCGTASGVLVTSELVLTAHHVVNCATWPAVRMSNLTLVVTSDGTKRLAKYEVLDGARDLARLRIDAVSAPTPLTIARASKGDVVCAATASPERTYRCGVVESANVPRDFGDFKVAQMSVWFGNSGSGVYDTRGRLVALAVRLHWCSDHDRARYEKTKKLPKPYRPARTCGANISTIEGPVAP